MGPIVKNNRQRIDKRFLSKNKTIKLYKEKQSKIDLYQKEVSEITSKYEQFDSLAVEKFEDFPLSSRSRKGLRDNGYVTPTEIQKESIGLALKGHDILGAAKTGSGKTLAFVLPVLEKLFCLGWSILDGLGALIITPTRELAYQIFEVLNKVGSYHQFSVALVIGGKDLALERKVLNKCNILICTPGRLLQHMDENPLFDSVNLKILVLDEADRILDLGFQKTVNAILENLPQERQTLLFSATQTKSVKDLARLSLKNPVYVSVHEHAKHTTPEGLQQSYVVCEAHDKVNMMWSFIKSHKQQKILVFMASCKQVKFMYESFCRMRPGVSVLALYGSLHQLRRIEIYDEFCRKNHAVMFATDVAARGLDFPNVNWVVQLDCPEDVNTYIHRAGRTARFQKGGEALLVLLPSEEKSMVKQLKSRKIPIEEIKVNPSKLRSVQKKLEAICARDVNLKDSGQRGFKAYLKNIFLMKDKTVFDVSAIDVDLYAKSIGLASAPRVRFLEKHMKTQTKKETSDFRSTDKKNSLFANNSSDESDDDLLKPVETTYINLHSKEEEENDDFEDEEPQISKKPLTKAALAKRILKKKIKPNTAIKFDEKGEPIREVCGQRVPVVAAELHKELEEEGYSIEKAKLLKEKEDEVDKLLYKERIKSKHLEAKLALKKKKSTRNPEGAPATLNVAEDSIQQDENSDSESGSIVDPNDMSASNSESEDEISHDLEINESDSEENESADESSEENESVDESEGKSEEDHISPRGKRKLNTAKRPAKKLRIVEDNSKKVKSGRSIEDDEQLALHFLNNT